MEKLCVFCENFGWNSVSIQDWGGQTGAGIDGGGLTCSQGMIGPLMWTRSKWEPKQPQADPSHEYLPSDTEDFRRVISIAARCEHYKPPT